MWDRFLDTEEWECLKMNLSGDMKSLKVVANEMMKLDPEYPCLAVVYRLRWSGEGKNQVIHYKYN